MVFDAKCSFELIDDEFAIHKEFNLGPAKLDSSRNREVCGRVFGLVIGADSEIFIAFFEWFFVGGVDDHSRSSWSRISTRTTIGK